jgi:hypothetical protein
MGDVYSWMASPTTTTWNRLIQCLESMRSLQRLRQKGP